MIYSDPEKIEQILLNLLLNAQKFTSKGWIKFKIIKVLPRKNNAFLLDPASLNKEASLS